MSTMQLGRNCSKKQHVLFLTCHSFRVSEKCCFPSRLIQDVEWIVNLRVHRRERPQAADGADDGYVLVHERSHALAVQVAATAIITCRKEKYLGAFFFSSIQTQRLASAVSFVLRGLFFSSACHRESLQQSSQTKRSRSDEHTFFQTLNWEITKQRLRAWRINVCLVQSGICHCLGTKQKFGLETAKVKSHLAT